MELPVKRTSNMYDGIKRRLLEDYGFPIAFSRDEFRAHMLAALAKPCEYCLTPIKPADLSPDHYIPLHDLKQLTPSADQENPPTFTKLSQPSIMRVLSIHNIVGAHDKCNRIKGQVRGSAWKEVVQSMRRILSTAEYNEIMGRLAAGGRFKRGR